MVNQTTPAEKVEFLKAQVGSLSTQDQTFAHSLIHWFETKGHLSFNQALWVVRLTDKAMGFGPVATSVELAQPLSGFSKVLDLLNVAASHLKYPRIKFAFHGQQLELTLCGQKAKTPGSVNVTDGLPYGKNKWFGRVSPTGVWMPPKTVTPEQQKIIRRALQALGENPADIATHHGKVTGNCCFCYKKLTDPRSTAVGYGETCASHYGLHSKWIAAASVFDKYKALEPT